MGSPVDHDSPSRLVACHECDLLARVPALPPGGVARCPRCNGILARAPAKSFERTAALGFAALTLLVVSNLFPFLTLDISGTLSDMTIIQGARTLWDGDYKLLAGLVFGTTVLAPLTHIVLLLWIVVPLWMNRIPWAGRKVLRWLDVIRPWSMAEVFMLGVLVSMVKLADLADIIPGIALWSFVALIPVLTASLVTLDNDLAWRRIAPEIPVP